MNQNSKIEVYVTDHVGKQEVQAYAGNINPPAVASHLKWVRAQPDVKFAHIVIDGAPVVSTDHDKASKNQWKEEVATEPASS